MSVFKKTGRKNTLDKVRSLVSAKFNKEVEDVTESNIQDLRNKVNSVIKELKDKAKNNKKGSLTRYINSVNQKIIGEIDNLFPENEYIIFTTKSSQ